MNEMDVFRIVDNRTSPQTVKEYEVVDGAAREDISELKADFLQSLIYDTVSGSVATFPDGAHELLCKSVVAQIVPKQSGSGDPSPDNVRPVSGWDAVEVVRTGKNLFNVNEDISADKFYYNADGTTTISSNYRTSGWIKVKPNTSYFWAINGVPPATGIGTHNAPRVAFFDADRNWLMSGGTLGGYGSASVSPSNAVWARVPVYANPSVPTAMFVEGTQIPSTYEPYTCSTYPVTLPQTVYGGQVDVVSGEGKIVYASAVFDGTESWDNRTGCAGVFSHTITGMPNNSSSTILPDIISDYLPTVTQANIIATATTQGVSIFTWGNQIVVKLPGVTTLADFKAYLSEHPLTVVYPLITPTDFSVTPQEVPTLYGSNAVYADSGDVVVEYPADTKLYLSRLTEPDSDMIADANIVSGKYFMVGNDLYLATANIANGGAIVPGTNCTKVSLATALNAINS